MMYLQVLLLLVGCTVIFFSAGCQAVTFNCRSNRDCDTSAGQQCQRLVNGCDVGRCVCNMDVYTENILKQCLKLGDQQCNPRERCAEGMRCYKGRCQCHWNRYRMTEDKTYCLLPNERLLGEACDPSTKCLRKNAHSYTEYEVECSNGYCECEVGYKRHGHRCIPHGVNEYGCLRQHHCQGGALCEDFRCVCPDGYTASVTGTCIRTTAVRDLPEGYRCNEINNDGYCSPGLVCHRCPTSDHHRCYRPAPGSPYISCSSTTSHLLSVFVTFLFTALSQIR